MEYLCTFIEDIIIPHLKCVPSTVPGLLDLNHLQDACVLDLMENNFIIKVQLFLEGKIFTQVINFVFLQSNMKT